MDYFNESWLDWIVLHKTGNILSDMRCCACQFEGLGFSHWTPPRLLQWYGISCHLRIYVQQHDHLSFNQVWLPQTVAPRLWSQTQNPDLYSCQLPQGCNIQRWQHGTFYQRWGPSHGVRMELCWRWAALIFFIIYNSSSSQHYFYPHCIRYDDHSSSSLCTRTKILPSFYPGGISCNSYILTDYCRSIIGGKNIYKIGKSAAAG